jgi:hypothetical protein
MAYTDVITIGYQSNSISIANQNKNITGDGQIGYDGAVPDNTINALIHGAFAYGDVKACCISSDRDVTIKTNSTSSPGNTLNIAANTPLVYYLGGPWANPFTADVTQLYVTNSSGAVANVKVRVLYDPTPTI